MEARSRSDASGHHTTARQVAGVVWYSGGPVDRPAFVQKQVRSSHFGDKYPEKYQAASLENIHKSKKLKELEDEEEIRYLMKKELEMLESLGFALEGTKETLKILTYEQFQESKADYPVRPEWKRNCETPEAVKPFKAEGVLRKKSRSETKLPKINREGLPESNWADVQSICKSLSQLGV